MMLLNLKLRWVGHGLLVDTVRQVNVNTNGDLQRHAKTIRITNPNEHARMERYHDYIEQQQQQQQQHHRKTFRVSSGGPNQALGPPSKKCGHGAESSLGM